MAEIGVNELKATTLPAEERTRVCQVLVPRRHTAIKSDCWPTPEHVAAAGDRGRVPVRDTGSAA
jgi:hypothetical protein